MHWLYAALRFYPFWAVPAALIMVELGRYYRRKAKKQQFFCFGLSAGLVLTSLLWLILRGDKYSDSWVRAWLE